MAYDDFAISAIQRSTIYERQRISEIRQESSERFNSGLRINQVRDDPTDYFRAQALTNRISNLLDTKAGVSQGIETLNASQAGLSAIEKLTDQLTGLALSAQSADSTQRAEIAAQFDTIRNQLDLLAADTSYQGTNLISTPADSARISVSDSSGDPFVIAGQASDSASLGINSATGTYNSFATQADIDAAILATETAKQSVQTHGSNNGVNAAILDVRAAFIQDLANTLQAGLDKLINANLNEEAAKALAANVRDGLAQEGSRITAESERQIVELVRGTE